MKYYNDNNNVVYALDDNDDPEIWIPTAVTEISEEEAMILLPAQPEYRPLTS